jgi:Mn-containing catalase
MKKFADLFVNASRGPGDAEGPWNTGEQWEKLDRVEENLPLEGGFGMASVKLKSSEGKLSKPWRSGHLPSSCDLITGADLGAGPGAGSTSAKAER